jgi:hypothetical protein
MLQKVKTKRSVAVVNQTPSKDADTFMCPPSPTTDSIIRVMGNGRRKEEIFDRK